MDTLMFFGCAIFGVGGFVLGVMSAYIAGLLIDRKIEKEYSNAESISERFYE